MSLNDYRAVRDAAQAVWRSHRDEALAIRQSIRDAWERLVVVEAHAKEANLEYRAAKELFQIARDHGEDAALLYKLSDGHMDPRKAEGE